MRLLFGPDEMILQRAERPQDRRPARQRRARRAFCTVLIFGLTAPAVAQNPSVVTVPPPSLTTPSNSSNVQPKVIAPPTRPSSTVLTPPQRGTVGVLVPPTRPASAPPAQSSSNPNELAPTIEAVRTQLEILSPPVPSATAAATTNTTTNATATAYATPPASTGNVVPVNRLTSAPSVAQTAIVLSPPPANQRPTFQLPQGTTTQSINRQVAPPESIEPPAMRRTTVFQPPPKPRTQPSVEAPVLMPEQRTAINPTGDTVGTELSNDPIPGRTDLAQPRVIENALPTRPLNQTLAHQPALVDVPQPARPANRSRTTEQIPAPATSRLPDAAYRVAQDLPAAMSQPALSIDQIPASQFPRFAPTTNQPAAPAYGSTAAQLGTLETLPPRNPNASNTTGYQPSISVGPNMQPPPVAAAPILESPSPPPARVAPMPSSAGISTEDAAIVVQAPIPQTQITQSPVLPAPAALPLRTHGIQLEIAGANGPEEPMWQFNFQNAPWSVVIRSFAKQNGMALQMLQEPSGSFTFVDERPYTATEALDLLNDYLLAEGFLLVRNNSKLTTIAAGASFQEGIVPFIALRQIDGLSRNELASVAIPIKSTEAGMVMNEIQPLLSRLGRAQIVSNSSRLIVTDTGLYLRRVRDILGGYGLAAHDIQTTVFHLRNTTAESVALTIGQHLGGAGAIVASSSSTGAVQQASFTTTSMTSARVIPDKETNSLVISGTPAEVAEIQSLICELDRARAQVVLQGLILEVNLGNVRELGAELGLQDSVLFNRSVIDNLVTLQQTNTAPNGVQTTTQQVISQTSAPGFNFNNQPLGNNTAVSPNVIGTQGLANLGVGRTNSQLGFGGLVLSAGSNSVNILLRALQANYEVDVLSRPQIRTVDDKEAFIQIGQQVPVVDGVTVTAVGTANPIIRQDQAGIILKMTPHVSPDGLIQIKVNAEKSAFKLSPGTGVPIFTDARNGTVIQAPIKDITTAQATVSARAGQTIVLGGMITRDEETIERRVPGLSRIPLIGRLFRYDYNNVVRKELLIFLTPQLITDDETSDMMKDAEIARTHAPLERAVEIHGNLISGPREPVIVDETVVQDAAISGEVPGGSSIMQPSAAPMVDQ